MTFDSLITNIKWRFSKIFLSKEQRYWINAKKLNSEFRKGKLISLCNYISDSPIKPLNQKRVVCIFDGKTKNGGLADRLRGIVSVYEVCKEQNLDFKILFTSPFNLSEFLVPNKVDWRINEEELNYNTNVTDICYIDTLTGSDYEAAKQKKWFRKEFKKQYKEFHIRTNALFSYKGHYSSLFHELFRPSEKLQASINKQKEILNHEYISTSFRFMNLLGDFNETTELHNKLTKEEQDKLITINIKQLHNLHNKYPHLRILVNSDSTTFLQEAKKIDYVYVIPGNVTHIDAENNCNKYDIYEKTFIDFFMIANAQKIYLMRTGQMYNSGYPYAASKIYDKPFEKIEF